MLGRGLAALLAAAFLSRIQSVVAAGPVASATILHACKDIEKAVSSRSAVFYPGSPRFLNDTDHFSAANEDTAVCVLEPGSAKDVSKALKILGPHRIPFAVKSGGHMSNPHSSSTTGILLALTRLSSVTHNPTLQTASIGPGAIWVDVYKALDPLNVTVVGGRVAGPGVGGFTLGGGYSYLTNQHGLAQDNIVSMEVVLPNGEIVEVAEGNHPDLFFALKGTWNNFGIVTNFKFRAYPIGQVFGGLIVLAEDKTEAVKNATLNYIANVKDKKSSVIVAFNTFTVSLSTVIIFYDGPTAPPGIFDEFLAIPAIQSDISIRSYSSLVQTAGGPPLPAERQLYAGTPLLQYTSTIIDQIINQTKFYGAEGSLHGQTGLTYAIEPFLPTLFDTSQPAAYPHTPSLPLSPFQIGPSWSSPSEDAYFLQASLDSGRVITDQAVAEGQTALRDNPNAVKYGNYAPYGTPVEKLWGTNVARLRSLKKRYDPDNVMGLAGGFKVPT